MPAVITIITGINPGQTAVYDLAPIPAGSVLPFGIIPTWTSTNTAIATVEADPTGLIGTVTGITDGTCTINVEATLPKGPVTGSATQVVGPLLTGFAPTQVA